MGGSESGIGGMSSRINWPSLAVQCCTWAEKPVLANSNKNRPANSVRIDNPENSDINDKKTRHCRA
jgi:hypothetical protein